MPLSVRIPSILCTTVRMIRLIRWRVASGGISSIYISPDINPGQTSPRYCADTSNAETVWSLFWRIAVKMSGNDYKFEGWLGLDASSAEGKMVWKEFEPKPWEETDVDIKITHCGICGSDLHTLRSGWVSISAYRTASTVRMLTMTEPYKLPMLRRTRNRRHRGARRFPGDPHQGRRSCRCRRPGRLLPGPQGRL